MILFPFDQLDLIALIPPVLAIKAQSFDEWSERNIVVLYARGKVWIFLRKIPKWIKILPHMRWGIVRDLDNDMWRYNRFWRLFLLEPIEGNKKFLPRNQ